MNRYEHGVLTELAQWKREMQARPGISSKLAMKMQGKLNSLIPEKVHVAISAAIREMVKGVLTGATYISPPPLQHSSLETREIKVLDTMQVYKNTGAAEGGIAGAGGFLLALAEFPVLLATKMKMLFDIAAHYGYDTRDYRERLYLLHIFQLAFSSQERRNNVFRETVNWNQKLETLPANINEFEWRRFQQEYRDYIDLAKIAQLVPVIGAAVGVVVNYRLMNKLGVTAMNCFRMRWEESGFTLYQS